MTPTINEISKRIAIDFRNIDIQAKNLLQVLVCGSYKTEEDHNIIKKFRDRQKEKGISGTFLMEDIKLVDERGNEVDMPTHEKMHLIWNVMKDGHNIPLFILFAGKSANISIGLNAEIQTIAHDKKKIDCAYLFKIRGVELVSHESCFSNIKIVENEGQFIEEAEKIIDANVKQAKMFYQAKKEEKV